MTSQQNSTDDSVYHQFLEIAQALDDADVPTENRVMYYYLWSWWRHPIKRWRQKQALKKLAEL